MFVQSLILVIQSLNSSKVLVNDILDVGECFIADCLLKSSQICFLNLIVGRFLWKGSIFWLGNE